MHRCAVLNVVGLTPRLLGEHTPRLLSFVNRQRLLHVEPVMPALTCSAQATYFTGLPPGAHGAVANGWYDRPYAEHRFWKQPESLVTGPRLWEELRHHQPNFTCAKVFWWFNMHSSADYTITPRPLYPSDGSKVFDVHTQPMDMREAIKADLGPFPFPQFWGPMAGIESSRWIAQSARWIEEQHRPTLSLVYLPHLDYNLQRHGLDFGLIAQDLRDIDQLVGELIDFYEGRGISVILLSEYGITNVDRAVHLNRLFRQKRWLSIKDELGRETLDQGGCRVFAIADHQIAHVYVRDSELLPQVRALLEQTPGVEQVWDRADKVRQGLDHPRSGDLVAVADARSWFTYYYWNDDSKAPDFARCVDIHRKCGYDPVELFLEQGWRGSKRRIALKLLQKKLGQRTLMDVIPLDASLVKGSHGRLPEQVEDWPLLVGGFAQHPNGQRIAATEVYRILLRACGGPSAA